MASIAEIREVLISIPKSVRRPGLGALHQFTTYP